MKREVIYTLIKMEAFSDRPEVLFASSSKNRIDIKLEEMKNEYNENVIFDYEEGDCLILEDDTAFYIEKAGGIL